MKGSLEIRCLVFDWYGVCAYEPFIYIVARELEAKLGLSKEKVSVSFKKFLKPYLTDDITGEKFIELIFLDLGLNNWSDFYYLLNKHSEVNWSVMNLVKQLKAKYKTILYSDSFKGPFEQYEKTVGEMSDFFDLIILSHKLKIHKEEPRMYQYLIEQAEVKPQEMLFVDDWEKNLVLASSFGINCIQFKSHQDLLSKFVEMKIM